ncbi:unnamed protein product [Rotaria magnacalcarata]|uniref:BHLH domain-containing protein n=1 Tax=Rotaria magnacalcarata TaxID=392030 RepID=A0A8S2L9B6_9BILA|nr:unnamed protein product [Rotaria magnacalcarata]
MSKKVQQFDEFQSQPSLNGSSTVLDACDFTVSDKFLNDILRDFDVNTNDAQCFDGSINDINYFHSSQDLLSSCKATLYSTTINTNVQSFQSGFHEVVSPDAFELLIEQQEKQQANNEPSFSFLSYKSIDHRDPSSKDISNYEAGNICVTREETATTRTDSSSTEPSFQFFHLNNSTEPITFTVDQFQALINLIPNTSQTSVNTISTLLEHSTIFANNIPLRIVDQTNHLPNTDISSKFSHQDAITKNDNSSESIVVNRNGNCPRRKLTSNAIEKRYRSSINEKIYELKEIVAASDGKIQKSGILRRTVEYIGQLQSTNRQLEEENSTLKSILKQLNLTTTDLPTNNDVQSSKKNSLVKKSTTSTSAFNSEFKDDLYSPAEKRHKQANSTREPIVHESDMNEYYTYKKKADALMDKNQFSEASIYYKKCCEKLYVSIDQTYLYYFSSITWQLIRLFLNVIFLGRWLTYWSGWTKSIDTRYHNCELNSCYLQLWKVEYHQSKSLLNIFNLFLLTLNTSINAGKKLNRNKRNEINFLSALTLKKLDGLFSIFTIFFLKFLIPIDTNDIWLLHVDRLNQFIYEKDIYLFKKKIFLESIRIQFFEYILYDNIQNQLLFQDEQPQQFIIKNENELDLLSWWQHSLQVIRCISNDKQNINNITSTDLLQHMNSSNKTIYGMARSIKIVSETYILIIETIHIILLILTNNDDDQTNSTRILFLKQLGKSSKLLTSMIESCYITDNEDNLDMAIKTLLLDSILSLRLRLLTCSMTNNNKKIPFLDDFQRELDCYRRVNQFMKLPKQKLYLFESIFRTLSGLNPLLTQTLFECAIKQSKSIIPTTKESLPSLDIIAALLLFCHFSPSTVYRYRNILQQAAVISSKASENNDLNRLQRHCWILIRQQYFTM